MTLGEKLSGYRKIAGLTQQQLGERLNVSAQAISKWENDLSEPDITTLRALAELYRVTVDDLLAPNGGFPDPKGEEAHEEESEPSPGAAMPLGFCRDCGIAVTPENLGISEPVVLCARCATARKENAAREAERQKAAAQEIERKKREWKAVVLQKIKDRRRLAFWIAALADAVFIGIMIGVMVGTGFHPGKLAGTLIGAYAVYTLVFCLFYDGWTQDVVFDWTSKSFQAPGLIFEFDFDGCLWMIGMKILFWIIGGLFAVVVGAIGVTLGAVIAMFEFPYFLVNLHRSVQSGVPCDFEDQVFPTEPGVEIPERRGRTGRGR